MEYSKLDCFWGNYALVAIGENPYKWGLINRKGELTVKPIYDNAVYIGGNYVIANIGYRECFKTRVYNSGMWALIDTNGNEIIPAKYSALEWTDNDFHLLIAQNYTTELFGVINTLDEIIVPFTYKQILTSSVQDCFHIITTNDKHGLIDNNGQVIIEAIYDDMNLGWDGDRSLNKWFAVSIAGTQYYLDVNGKRVLF